MLRTQSNSLGEKLFFFVSGIVVGAPVAIFFEAVSHAWFTSLGVATIVAPFVEEFAKADPLFFKHEKTGRSLMSLGFLAGLGFGIAEFIVYVVGGVPFLVRLPAIVFHAAGTSIVGYGVYRREPIRYYFVPVALHFTNNLFASLGWPWFIGGLSATVVTYYVAWRLWKQSEGMNLGLTQLGKFCTNCGSPQISGAAFCSNCGSKQGS
jgi:hypothetical protein